MHTCTWCCQIRSLVICYYLVSRYRHPWYLTYKNKSWSIKKRWFIQLRTFIIQCWDYNIINTHSLTNNEKSMKMLCFFQLNPVWRDIYTSCTLHLEFEFMFKECEEQKTGPTHQQAEVLEEKHETRPVGLHSTHLWKLTKETRTDQFW